MTKLLEQAFETLSRLPPDAQDDVARALLGMAAEEGELDDIEPEHLEAVMEGRRQAERGEFSELTPDEAVAAAFRRHAR